MPFSVECAGAGTSALTTQHTTDMPTFEAQPGTSALLKAMPLCLTHNLVS